MDALVYVNHGRVIADCPYGCGNAYRYTGQPSLLCDGPGGCMYEFQLVAPENLSDLVQELSKRPAKENQNWFPDGHPIAVRGTFPMGQTTADLSAEFKLEREQLEKEQG